MNTRMIITGLFFIFIIITSGYAEEQHAPIQGENVSFTPLEEEYECNTTITSVMHVEREEYETGIEPLDIEYQMLLNHTNESKAQHTTVTKTINKYSEADTGEVRFTKAGVYELSIRISEDDENNTKTREWDIESPCNASTDANGTDGTSASNTTPEETNNTMPDTNQTDEINESEGNDTEEDANQDEDQNTNNTEEKGAELFTDKTLYAPGEQATLSFSITPEDSEYSITYWIEDLDGKMVKQKYTTENLDEKHHTFNDIEQSEKAYVARANITISNSTFERKRYMILKSEKEEKGEQEEQKGESRMEIKDVTLDDGKRGQHLNTEITIHKGDTRSQVVTMEVRDEDDTLISEKPRVKLIDRYSSINLELPIKIEERTESGTIHLTLSGLDMTETEKIPVIIGTPETTGEEGTENEDETTGEKEREDTEYEKEEPEIIRTYTRQKYLDDHLNWYVHVKAEGSVAIEAMTDKEKVSANTTITGKDTVKMTFENPQEKMHIQTIVQGEENMKKRNDTVMLTKDDETEDEKASLTGNTVKEEPNMTGLLESTKTAKETNTTLSGETQIMTSKMIKRIAIAIPTVVSGIIVKQYLTKKKRSTDKKEMTHTLKNKNPERTETE